MRRVEASLGENSRPLTMMVSPVHDSAEAGTVSSGRPRGRFRSLGQGVSDEHSQRSHSDL